jgi:hypothetical protein
MRKLGIFLTMAVLTASLYAQSVESGISNVYVYVSPAIGGTEAEREYFDFNLQEEVIGGGYELTNDLYADPDEAWSYSDFYIDVELSYDAEYDEHIITLTLYDTWTGNLIVTSGMAYSTLEEMNDWNLTLIYRAMANAPISKWVGDLPATGGSGFGLGSGQDPDHWLHLGLRVGPSLRFHAPMKWTLTQGISFDVGVQLMFQALPYLGIQAELIFTMDNAPDLAATGNNLGTQKNNFFSLMFPVIVKGTFHLNQFLIQPLVGVYFPIFLNPGYKISAPVGLTAGITLGIPMGPGNILIDARYSFDFANTTWTNGASNPQYKRSMFSLTVGYEIHFLKKNKKAD